MTEMEYEKLKRVLDIIGSLVGLIVLSPLYILVALAIKFDSQGPIFADTPMNILDQNIYVTIG